MKIIISIIIPIYNTQKYLKKCIDSCLNQDIVFKEYEIILVDDGSTDNSLTIAREFQKRHENIQVLTQENKKQGAARNLGLKYAKGEYIWFVDSDDWIEMNVLGSLIKKSTDNNLDLLAFSAVDNFENGNDSVKRKIDYTPNKVYQDREVLLENKFNVNLPFHIFKKKFLIENNLIMLENIYYEDNEFMIRVFDKVKRFLFYDFVCYNVLKRDGSTTSYTNYVNFFSLLKVIESLITYVEKNKLPDEAKKVFCKHIAECQNSLLWGTRKSKFHFHKAAESIRYIDKLKSMIYQSQSIAHIFQYQMLKYPSFLRRVLIFHYK